MILTQEFLDQHPDLVQSGYKAGDDYPSEWPEEYLGGDNNATTADGPGGADPSKPRPPKPL